MQLVADTSVSLWYLSFRVAGLKETWDKGHADVDCRPGSQYATGSPLGETYVQTQEVLATAASSGEARQLPLAESKQAPSWRCAAAACSIARAR